MDPDARDPGSERGVGFRPGGTRGGDPPSEANPEGPMSFALGADGTLFLLDQRNRRVQEFVGGKRKRSLSLERDTWIDLDAVPGGGLALLDPSPPGEVRLLAPSGEVRFATALEGKRIARAAE